MSRQRDELIATLAMAATPVHRPGRIAALVIGWLSLAFALATLALWLGGPFRDGAFEALLLSSPRLLETALGGGAIIGFALAAFRSGIPGHSSKLRQAGWPAMLLMAWIGAYIIAWTAPDAVYSMAGKRLHCWLEALLYGVPGLVLGCLALKRLYPLHGAWSGLLLGLSAGAMPALLMQSACMWEPGHILLFHLLPGLLLGGLGAALGLVMLRPASFSGSSPY